MIERQTLRFILHEPKLANGLSASLFPEGKLREIFELCKAGADYLGVIEARPDFSALVSEILTQDIAETVSFERSAEILKQQYQTTGLKKTLLRAIQELSQGGGESVVESLKNELGSLGFKEKAVTSHLSILDKAERELFAEKEEAINWTLPSLQRYTGGLSPRRLYIVAARPATGKTAFCQQIAIQAARAGFRPLVISMEMGQEELALRSISHIHKIPLGALTQRHEEAVNAYRGRDAKRDQLEIFYETDTYRLSDLESLVVQRARKGTKLVIVDHIGLVSHGSDSEYLGLGKITRNFKILGKRHNIAVLAVCQLSRFALKEGREADLTSLRGSGLIEENADFVALLESAGEMSVDGKRPIEINILKNRSGLARKLSSSFIFDGRYQSITETAERNSDE